MTDYDDFKVIGALSKNFNIKTFLIISYIKEIKLLSSNYRIS